MRAFHSAPGFRPAGVGESSCVGSAVTVSLWDSGKEGQPAPIKLILELKADAVGVSFSWLGAFWLDDRLLSLSYSPKCSGRVTF